MKEYIPIPKVFHSFATDKPFSACTICNKSLLENDTQYMIEKAIKQYPGYGAHDVLFECALCIPCITAMRESLSRQSVKVISQYLGSRVNLAARREHLLKNAGLQVHEWLAHCLITGKRQDELNEFHLYGHCDGADLVFSYLPYMISEQTLHEITALLSKETKDVLDDFIDAHFGLPPELKEQLKSCKAVLM